MKLRIILTNLILALGCTQTYSVTFPMPKAGNEMVGNVFRYTTTYEDTFSDIARLYGLGFRQLKAANPDIDPWLPGEGKSIVIPQQYLLPPGPWEDIIINLAELRLYYFPKDRDEIETYPLGIGREGWTTPVGETKIVGKKKDPTWTVPASILKEHLEKGDPLPPSIGPGPNNPLGQHALYLGFNGYLLHGTNKPYGVGMRVSHGCIRLYPEDIEWFFEQVPVGAKVRIINQPFKAGWHNSELFVEAHQPLSEQVDTIGINYTGLVSAVLAKLGDDSRSPDWSQLNEYGELLRGIPMPIYLQQDETATLETKEDPLSLNQEGPQAVSDPY